jgi:sigma-B regulation protein RsbU (phosphoserine phosphatase)
LIKSFSYNIPEYAKDAFIRKIDFQNHVKIKYLCCLLILVLLPLIIFSDLSDLRNTGSGRYYHDVLNTLCDLGFLSVSIITAIINFTIIPDKPEKIKKFHVATNYIFVFLILMICSLNSVVDQLTSGSFIVYLLGVLTGGILMNMRLINAIIIYVVPQITFITGVALIQKDSGILAANIANSIVAFAIGLFICGTFYNIRLNDFNGHLTIENQNKELTAKSKSLENLTSELQTKNLELELDRRQIKIKNRQLEIELGMAKRIQLQMIPKVPPFDKIAVFYRPMEQLGGDFYDFISFKEKTKTGIFISDISGHGAPAAMMTSMIKSFILQSEEWNHHPSLFLSQLNLLLLNLSTELFITALYGVYDFSNRTFTYANAGHNLPYIIFNNKIENLPFSNKGIPLGVLDNDDSPSKLCDLTVTLEANTKLLIYTDGLTDTISSYNMMENFESYELKRSMLELSKLPPVDFVERLLINLLKFKGNENFDDDICMICLQS